MLHGDLSFRECLPVSQCTVQPQGKGKGSIANLTTAAEHRNGYIGFGCMVPSERHWGPDGQLAHHLSGLTSMTKLSGTSVWQTAGQITFRGFQISITQG